MTRSIPAPRTPTLTVRNSRKDAGRQETCRKKNIKWEGWNIGRNSFSAGLYGSKRRKATVLVKHVWLAKANFPQQIKLRKQRPWRIFALDIREHAIAVIRPLESCEI